MGLDQYAYACESAEDLMAIDQRMPEGCSPFFVWRKHPDLQGWMERLYQSKGGREEFNCKTVRLEEADLDLLESDVRNARLPKTSGFFFGASVPEDAADDLNFIRQARAKIKEGLAIYYDSWW